MGLSVVGAKAVAEAVAVVADGNGDMVGGDLVVDLGGRLNNGLDHGVVGHSADGGKGVGSVGHRQVRAIGETVSGKNNLGVRLPLDHGVGEGQAVAETVVSKASAIAETEVSEASAVAKTEVADASVGSMVGDGHSMVGNRSVVDQGGGSADDPGVSVNHGGIGLPLDDSVGEGQAVAETVVSEASAVAKVSEASAVAKTEVANASVGSMVGDGHSMVGDRSVVDQGGGSADNPGVSVQHGGIGLPLAVVTMSVAVVTNSDGDMVGGDLMGDLGGRLNNGLDNGVVGHSADGGKCVGSVGHGHGQVVRAIGETVSAEHQLGVCLRGGHSGQGGQEN